MMKAIVILPGRNKRGFDVYDWLVNELGAHKVRAEVMESETDAGRIKGPRVGVYNALPRWGAK